LLALHHAFGIAGPNATTRSGEPTAPSAANPSQQRQRHHPRHPFPLGIGEEEDCIVS